MVEVVKNKFIKDLHWVCSTPSLLRLQTRKETIGLVKQILRWATENLENFPDTIRIQHKKRLGVYCEEVLSWAIDHHPDFELIAKGLQIQDEGITLGELDFVFKHLSTGRHYHLELAVKFYLYHKSAPKSKAFIGPNAVDRLDIKMARLVNHQLQLTSHKATSRWLAENFISEITPLGHVPGILFYHWPDTQLFIPEGIIDYGKKGIWLYQQEWSAFAKKNTQDFILLEKLNWLSPSCSNPSDYLSAAKIATFIHQEKWLKSILFFDPKESRYVFLVPNNWPTAQ